MNVRISGLIATLVALAGTLTSGRGGGLGPMFGAALVAAAAFSTGAAAQTLTTLHSFDGSDGADPSAGLVADAAGNLYGTTVRRRRHYHLRPLWLRHGLRADADRDPDRAPQLRRLRRRGSHPGRPDRRRGGQPPRHDRAGGASIFCVPLLRHSIRADTDQDRYACSTASARPAATGQTPMPA